VKLDSGLVSDSETRRTESCSIMSISCACLCAKPKEGFGLLSDSVQTYIYYIMTLYY
jgi:hypothetical protein